MLSAHAVNAAPRSQRLVDAPRAQERVHVQTGAGGGPGITAPATRSQVLSDVKADAASADDGNTLAGNGAPLQHIDIANHLRATTAAAAGRQAGHARVTARTLAQEQLAT